MSNIGSLFFCFFLVPCWPMILAVARRKVRVNHNLEGNILSDILCGVALCSCPFVACQLRDEIIFLKRVDLWKLGSDNDLNCCSEKFKFLNTIPFGIQGKNELIEFAKEHGLLEELNPEEAMINIGKIQRQYEEYIMENNSIQSLGSQRKSECVNNKDDNESNVHVKILLVQQAMRRV